MKSIHSIPAKKLRSYLKDQRESRGLSMRDVGLLVGRPHSFVSKIESGERRLDVVEFVWYCQALNIDPCEAIFQCSLTEIRADKSGSIETSA